MKRFLFLTLSLSHWVTSSFSITYHGRTESRFFLKYSLPGLINHGFKFGYNHTQVRKLVMYYGGNIFS